MWLNGGDGDVGVVLELFVAEPILRVGLNVGAHVLEEVVVESGDVYLSVDAFGDAGHLGMAVPVELETVGHEHEEQCELGLDLDG